ncbi:hypothetical protein CBM2633_B40086 [Cupriavidus taiwanensis]|uniref:Uncharacterized protein n=1 Tax=Cupriavidus taiwanensis TaxID=164546 RepID=A0A975XJ65_9BURK|nr:hypothetical protein CBM2586_B20083 [Cupriavidus taiwanensis]SPA21959.1 hypothetical protein CBM2633_B40086 [Cupriavidus taiwanensis]
MLQSVSKTVTFISAFAPQCQSLLTRGGTKCRMKHTLALHIL